MDFNSERDLNLSKIMKKWRNNNNWCLYIYLYAFAKSRCICKRFWGDFTLPQKRRRERKKECNHSIGFTVVKDYYVNVFMCVFVQKMLTYKIANWNFRTQQKETLDRNAHRARDDAYFVYNYADVNCINQTFTHAHTNYFVFQTFPF